MQMPIPISGGRPVAFLADGNVAAPDWVDCGSMIMPCFHPRTVLRLPANLVAGRLAECLSERFKMLFYMKSSAVLVLFTVLSCVLACPAAPPPGYQLRWSDEFNGDSLDTNGWNIETGRRHMAVNTAAAVCVTNGCLVLTTYSEGGINYTGFIDTKRKVLNGYGYYEASIQFSNSPGNWSAFWLQSPFIQHTNSLDNPTNGVEIDIFEHRRVDAKQSDWTDGGDHALHWNGYVKGIHKQGTFSDRNLGVASGFHTYGLLWTTNRYAFSIDGRVTWTTNYPVSSVKEFVLLTSEVNGKSWAGDVPAGGYPGRDQSGIKMFVDYVRYYAPAAGGVSP